MYMRWAYRGSVTSNFALQNDRPYQVAEVLTPTTYEIASLHNLDEPIRKDHILALTPFNEAANNNDHLTPMFPFRKRRRPNKVRRIRTDNISEN